jgi:hypothetical protein
MIRPSVGRDGGSLTTDLGFGKTEIFLQIGLDTTIAAAPVGQITLSRRASVRQGVGSLLVAAGAYFDMQRARIIEFALQNRLPAIYQLREYATAEGLLSYVMRSEADIGERAEQRATR